MAVFFQDIAAVLHRNFPTESNDILANAAKAYADSVEQERLQEQIKKFSWYQRERLPIWGSW